MSPASYTNGMAAVGIDVGGTTIKGVRLVDDGTIDATASTPTPSHDPDKLVSTLVHQALELGVGEGSVLGVAVAAFLDPTRRIVQFSPNISWANRPLASELEDILGVRVVLENDANAACFGEYRQGSGIGARSLAMFTLGTGVGGALMVGGELIVGSSGIAGELGHLVTVGGTSRCGCGARGCLETVASGTAILTQVRHLTGRHDAGPDEATDILMSSHSVRGRVLGEVADALADAIVTIRTVTNPDAVIIGGGVVDSAGHELVERIRQRVEQKLAGLFFSSSPTVLEATLGNQAGGIGVALLASDAVDTAL